MSTKYCIYTRVRSVSLRLAGGKRFVGERASCRRRIAVHFRKELLKASSTFLSGELMIQRSLGSSQQMQSVRNHCFSVLELTALKLLLNESFVFGTKRNVHLWPGRVGFLTSAAREPLLPFYQWLIAGCEIVARQLYRGGGHRGIFRWGPLACGGVAMSYFVGVPACNFVWKLG